MGGDDDIAASLPRPPLPAPARREAAIAEALRRFDGGAARPAAPARRPERRAGWWTVAGRPYAGALAGAALVVLIGLPVAWLSFPEPAADLRRDRAAAQGEAAPPETAMADAAIDSDTGADAGPKAALSAPPAAADRDGPAAPDELAGIAPAGPRDEPAPDAAADGEVVVTGSRISNPNPSSSSPIAVLNQEEVARKGGRSSSAAPSRRGDWNACTIEDPGRSLAACRSRVDAAARGADGRAAAHVADGLTRGWQGDPDAAIAAFDRAIALAPRSSAAYLNRGLAWRRRGDLDRALADLDRAVRFSPRAARYYFNRSLILDQRGEAKRARADAARAVELDPRYGAVVPR